LETPLAGSSWIRAAFQTALTAGVPWMPNWTMKPCTTRKKEQSLKKPILTRL
jgi:hypothetical protein